MQRGLDWYKRDPIAFLDAVQGLGPELIGAYAVLLDLIYARGGDTVRDDRHLSGVLGCSLRKARALTDALIETGKIEFHDGFITNSRAKREAKTRRNLSETRAKHGRAGGEKSGEARRNNSLREANALSKTEAEKEKSKSKSLPPLYFPPHEKPTPQKRGSRLADDWQPSDDDWNFAKGEGMTDAQIERTAETFRDYWHGKTGQAATKRDWAGTWRNWIRRDSDQRKARAARRDSGHQALFEGFKRSADKLSGRT